MSGTTTAKTRNSSIELLRIICIFGIIFMHTTAYGGEELAIYNRYILIVVNCFTNLGVTCFMLISGYYGVNFNLEKLIKIDLMMLLYSWIKIAIYFATGRDVGGMDLLSAAFPVLSNQYWYMTSYFVIALLSKWLNQIPEKLDRKDFKWILKIMIFLFAIVPTFLHFDILGKEGKNPVYMIMIYLIGRYIKKYEDVICKKSAVIKVLLFNLAITIILELALYTITGRYSMFYRDCSIFTLASSLLLFTLFKSMYFENSVINRLASCVLAVYVFSWGFQIIVDKIIPIENYAFDPMMFPLICIFAPCVVIGCTLVELIRQTLFGKMETALSRHLGTTLTHIVMVVNDAGVRIKNRADDYMAGKGE